MRPLCFLGTRRPNLHMEALAMDKFENLIKNAMVEADKARDQARLDQLKSPEFLMLAAMAIVSLISLFFLLSEFQFQRTTVWQVFTVWGCLVLSMVWSILAIFAPDRIEKLTKNRT
jgi:hypothetical protein